MLDLFADGARLVTIVGAGGIGKTRVALEAAARTPGAVEFVGLAAVDPAGLPAALVRTLAPAAPAERPPLAAIADALAGRNALVILDTFEHVLVHAGLIGELVDSCPDLRVLVTSRARLRLDGEQVVALPPLPGSASGPAVEMFLDRAHAIGCDVDAADADVVAQLCHHLDGVPLAIELAAARTPMLAPRALLARIRADEPGRLLAVLARGPVGAHPRHTSMRETIAWSYALLDASAQRVLRRCSVFPGAFGLDAAEQVSDCDVLDEVAALVDLHLLEPVDGPVGEPRYRMLDTIREFARAILDADADRARVLARLDAWCEALGREAGAGLVSAAERSWLERVEVELPTLRVTLTSLSQRGEIYRGALLATRLAPFWLHRGPIVEGRGWLESFLDADPDAQHLVGFDRAVATAWAARLALDEGDLAVAEEISRARDVIAAHPDAVGEWLQATEHLAYGLTLRGDLDQADAMTVEAIERARKASEPFWLATFLSRQTLSAERHGDLERAADSAAETIAVAGRIGYDRVVARAEQVMVRVRSPDLPHLDTHRALLANLAAHRDAVDERGVVTTMATLGAVWLPVDQAVAARWFRDGLDAAQRIGYWHGEAFCVLGLAEAASAAGRAADAVLLDTCLRPRLSVLKAGLPARGFDEYVHALADAREALGAECAAVERSAPSHWPSIRRHAYEIADRLGAATARTEVALPTRPDVRRRGPRANPGLTDRETQILAAIAAGRTNPQIASDLRLSPKTVMHHSSSIYRKLGVRGRAEAIAHVFRTAGRAPSRSS